MARKTGWLAAIAIWILVLPEYVSAQNLNPALNNYNKAIYGRPTVSPYLNLLRPQGGVGIPNYQSLVRPQLEQERTNQIQERQIQNLQSRTAPSSARSSGAPQDIRSTGHQTRFMNHSSFYPALGGDGGMANRPPPKPRVPGGGR